MQKRPWTKSNKNISTIKVTERLGVQETNLNTIKEVYSKPIANINLEINSEQFHQNQEQDHVVHSLQTVLEVLATAIR